MHSGCFEWILLQNNEYQNVILSLTTEITERILTDYSRRIGESTNSSCKPVGRGRIQTTTTYFDQSEKKEQRCTPLHLNKVWMDTAEPLSFNVIRATLSASIWVGGTDSEVGPKEEGVDRACNVWFAVPLLWRTEENMQTSLGSTNKCFSRLLEDSKACTGMFFWTFCCSKQIRDRTEWTREGQSP